MSLAKCFVSKCGSQGYGHWLPHMLDRSGAYGFKTEWTVAGDVAARTITLPLVQNRAEGALSYNCIVDWGDGTTPSVVTAYNDVNRIHTYASDGTYEVEITGIMDGWSFNDAGDKLKITDIIDWGDTSVFEGFKYLKGGFYGCTNLTSLGSGSIIPASGTGVLTDGFRQTFQNTSSVTAIPVSFFDNHTAVTTNAFRETFLDSAITAIPSDLFRYNTLASSAAFQSTFEKTDITTIPADIFRYNTAVTSAAFRETFKGCVLLETSSPDLFRYNINVVNNAFLQTFQNCNKFQQNKNIFYEDGAQATRFLNRTCDAEQCFDRISFTGTQGTAPNLWECDFGEVITLDVAPGTDWDPADIITGQSSGATAEVVSRTDATHYKIKKHVGTFTLDEVVGVTGVPVKLADQGAANPTFAGGPTMTKCWDGAGNSGVSLDNYGDIPADWV